MPPARLRVTDTGPTPADQLLDQLASTVADRLAGDLTVIVAGPDDMIEGVQAIADHLGLSRAHVIKRLGTEIPARQLGRSWITSKAALAKWVRDSIREAAA